MIRDVPANSHIKFTVLVSAETLHSETYNQSRTALHHPRTYPVMKFSGPVGSAVQMKIRVGVLYKNWNFDNRQYRIEKQIFGAIGKFSLVAIIIAALGLFAVIAVAIQTVRAANTNPQSLKYE